MNVNRKDLLNRLLSVEAGATSQPLFRQSDCVVVRRGRFYTFCQEIACSMASGLPKEFEGTLELKSLTGILKELPDEEVEVLVADGIFSIKGKSQRKVRLKLQEEDLLPVDDVEFPPRDGWKTLADDFALAVDMTHRCAKNKPDKELGLFVQCVHIHPEYVEASDNIRAVRYNTKTFVDKPVLVRGKSVKEMVQLGMTKGCETPNWLHFRNPLGLRLSVCKIAEENYPSLDVFINLRGEKMEFPKGMEGAVKRAGVLAGDDGFVEILVSQEGMVVSSKNAGSDYSESPTTDYRGPTIRFSVPPKLINEIVAVSNGCEVTGASLRVNGGKFVFVASLGVD